MGHGDELAFDDIAEAGGIVRAMPSVQTVLQ